MTDLSPAAWAVLCAYRDFSWTPDEEDNSRYYRFSHKAGMAAALRTAADYVAPAKLESYGIRYELLRIATELEHHNS
jgi:hypothetical protein